MSSSIFVTMGLRNRAPVREISQRWRHPVTLWVLRHLRVDCLSSYPPPEFFLTVGAGLLLLFSRCTGGLFPGLFFFFLSIDIYSAYMYGI